MAKLTAIFQNVTKRIIIHITFLISMKLHLVCSLIIVVVLAFAGCNSASAPTPNPTDTTSGPSKNLGLVSISPGTFTSGNMKIGYPESQVTLTKGFWMGKYEVTQALWKSIMGSIPDLESVGDSLPVGRLKFYDAVEFCNKLSAKEGLPSAYTIVDDTLVTWDMSSKGYRLPTQAEWEYACKAGTSTDTYNGDIVNKKSQDPVLDEIAWYKYTSGGVKHPVGLKKPNAWGLYDMIGNANELLWDKSAKVWDTVSKVDPVSDVWSKNEGGRNRQLGGSGPNNPPELCVASYVSGTYDNDRNWPIPPPFVRGLRLVRLK